jgi:PAS domain S-box-containing protein
LILLLLCAAQACAESRQSSFFGPDFRRWIVPAALPALALVTAALLAALAWVGVRQKRWKREIESTRAALNATADGLLVVDSAGAVVLCNRKFAETMSIPRTALETQRDSALLQLALSQVKSPDEFLATTRRLYSDPEAVSEDSIELNDGRVLERRSEPHRIGNRIVGRIWGFRDVTSARNEESALQEEAHMFRAFIDSLPERIYFKDRQSRFTRVNQAVARLVGLTDPQALIGKSDGDLYASVHAQAAYADEQNLVNGIVPFVSQEERETWPDGRETWVLTTKMPLPDPDGRIVGTFGVSRDITERKRMEQAIQEQVRWLSAVLGSIRDSVIALDSLGSIQWINASAAELTLASSEEWRGKLFEEIIHVAGLAHIPGGSESDLMNRLLTGSVSSLDRLDAAVRRADGTMVPVELTGSVIDIGGNVIAGAVLVLRAKGAVRAELS